MQHLLSLLPELSELGMYGYWFLFLITLLESTVVVGVLVPGATIIIAMSIAASHGLFHPLLLFCFGALGAIVGDDISYFLGTRGVKVFRDDNKYLRLKHLDRGRDFFAKHGKWSIFLGRFLPPLRAIVPFLAGLSKMDKRVFLFWNVVSGIIWAAAHVIIGYFLGTVYEQLVATFPKKNAFFIFLLILIIALLVLRKFYLPKRGRKSREDETVR